MLKVEPKVRTLEGISEGVEGGDEVLVQLLASPDGENEDVH